jgi:predicted house-cleaning noncanonical NTP pyrophosphatase (MazG superfamily)
METTTVNDDGKLVRDLIPDIIRNSGRRPEIRHLVGDELIAALGAKLVEEAQEAADVVGSRDDLVEELADVREVMAALMTVRGITDQELADAAAAKAHDRGAFASGVWLASPLTHLDRQEFLAWAYHDLRANTLRGVLAEYIVAKALGTLKKKRVEWDKYDLRVDDFGVEVKSAAYVQSWGTQPSTISFDISPKIGWDASTNTYSASAERSAHVYVFCLLTGTNRDHVDPLDVSQWTFYVLPTSVLNHKLPGQKRIRLDPLIALGPRQCKYDGLNAAVQHHLQRFRALGMTSAPISELPL